MGLLRRNKKENPGADTPPDSPAMAVQSPSSAESSTAEQPEEKKTSRNPIAAFRQWLIDSYNGVYKIVLKPSMPTISFVLLFIVGIIIGMIWAYAVSPTIWLDANPHRLRQQAQDEWIKMAAAAYDSGFYAEEAVLIQLNKVDNPIGAIQRMLNDSNLSSTDRAVLEPALALAESQVVSGTPAPEPAGFLNEIFSLILPLIVFAILTPIVVLIWRLLFYPNIVEPIRKQIRLRTDAEYRKEQAEFKKQKDIAKRQKDLLDSLKTQQPADEALGVPVMTSLSVFDRSRNYDDSFEIELPLDKGGDFLGQCGVAVDELVAPDPVAMEVWLFDMFAPPAEQNRKKILITPAANSDPSIRGRLEGDVDNPATDLIVAAPGANVRIDSQNLVLQAKLLSLTVGADGRFENYEMQVQAWQAGGGAATPAPAPVAPIAAPVSQPGSRSMDDYASMQFDPPPMPGGSVPPSPAAPPPGGRSLSDYDDIQFDPPPPAPGSGTTQRNVPPAAPPGGRSLSDYDDIQFDPPPPMPGDVTSRSVPLRPEDDLQPPPPLQYPPGMEPRGMEDDDDDPFGGTGDFTPLNR